MRRASALRGAKRAYEDCPAIAVAAQSRAKRRSGSECSRLNLLSPGQYREKRRLNGLSDRLRRAMMYELFNLKSLLSGNFPEGVS